MDKKTSEIIDSYFKAKEIEQINKLREEAKAEKLTKEKETRKKLHYMHCPKCGANMETIKMKHIEVDKCPECLGIYFDNSELEELLEKEFKKRRKVFRRIFGIE